MRFRVKITWVGDRTTSWYHTTAESRMGFGNRETGETNTRNSPSFPDDWIAKRIPSGRLSHLGVLRGRLRNAVLNGQRIRSFDHDFHDDHPVQHLTRYAHTESEEKDEMAFTMRFFSPACGAHSFLIREPTRKPRSMIPQRGSKELPQSCL